MTGLLENNKLILNQLVLFLKQLNNDNYQQKLEVFGGSSIGMHVRHIVEFYKCACGEQDRISYDNRERSLLLEENLLFCINQINELVNQIALLDLEKKIYLNSNTSEVEGDSDLIHSTLKRELLYCLDHSIHHMALLKMGVNISFPNIHFETNFGVAPSTVRHIKQQCAQ